MNITVFESALAGNLAEIAGLRDHLARHTTILRESSEETPLPADQRQQILRALRERESLLEWCDLTVSAMRGFGTQLRTVADLETDLASEIKAIAENL